MPLWDLLHGAYWTMGSGGSAPEPYVWINPSWIWLVRIATGIVCPAHDNSTMRPDDGRENCPVCTESGTLEESNHARRVRTRGTV